MLDFFIVIIMLFASSVFSAAETAVTYTSKARIHQLAKKGDKKAKRVLFLQEHLGMVIGVILTCVTLITANVATIGSSFFPDWLKPFAPIIVGTIILIYAEVMPKMLVLQNPSKFLLFFSPVLCGLLKLFHPFNILIHEISRWTLRIFGIQISHEQKNIISDREELRGVIDLHHGPTQDSFQERAMLKSILDLGSVPVSKIMVHRQNILMVDADLPTPVIVHQILTCPYTRVPLFQSNPDNIVGVIHVKALLRSLKNLDLNNINLNFSVLDLAQKPWFVPDTTDLLDQLQAFRSRREHFALVVDEYGVLMGIVTLEDILEEIVGDITDEHDIAVGCVRAQGDGSFFVYGHVTIRDLNRQFEWSLPDNEAATIAGLLIHKFRMIPKIGQIFHLKGFHFEVLRRQNNQIILIRIVPPNASSFSDEMDEDSSQD
jgi:Mg2+/Co2+ transporter CorB